MFVVVHCAISILLRVTLVTGAISSKAIMLEARSELALIVGSDVSVVAVAMINSAATPMLVAAVPVDPVELVKTENPPLGVLIEALVVSLAMARTHRCPASDSPPRVKAPASPVTSSFCSVPTEETVFPAVIVNSQQESP